MFTKAVVWIAAIAFHDAAEITILHAKGLSFDELDALGDWEAFLYALLCIGIFSGISLALDNFLIRIIESPLVSMKTVRLWEDLIKILTSGMAYITGAAWSTFIFGWVYDDDEDNLVIVFVMAVAMTMFAVFAERWLGKVYSEKKTDIIVADFQAVKQEEMNEM